MLFALCVSGSLPVLAQKGKSTIRSPRIIARPNIQRVSTQFDHARALSEGRGAWIEWQMESETNNLGFNIYRIDGKGKHLLSDSFVLGSVARFGSRTAYGESYNFFDREGGLGSVYMIEAVLMDGTRYSSQAFGTAYTTDLRAVSGFASEEYFAKEKALPDPLAKSDLVVSKDLKLEIDQNQNIADIDTQRWVASQPGAKIGVKKSGLHRVTQAELAAAGFDVNSDPALWQLYSDGVGQAIAIGTGGSYIEFYGKSLDTIESDTRMYYLLVGPTAGKRIATRIARPGKSTVISQSYLQTFEKKERQTYINSIMNGDAENYWGRLITSFSTATVTFDLTGVDFNVGDVQLEVKLQGLSVAPHSVGLTLNGQVLAPAIGNGESSFSGSYALPVSFLNEGANSLQMRSLNPTNDTNLFDSLKLTFARKHLADQNRLSFFTRNDRAAVLDGFTSANIRVFDTTIDGEPVLLSNVPVQQNGPTFGVKMPAGRGRVFFAVEDTGVLQAASVTQNLPSTLSTPSHNAQLVVISYKDWMAEAQAWANYRAQQGISVEVVNVEDIFDEFNYGVLSANSVKSFLEYAKTNWQTPPSYVLLLGDGSYDSRNYEAQITPPRAGSGFFNFVPVKIVNTLFSETGSDDALADFNGDGLSEIAIGRIPARNAQTVSNALAKVMAFEQPPMQTLDRGVIFAFDHPVGYDFGAMSGRLRDQLPAGTPSFMIDRASPTAQTDIINQINNGRYLVNWAGHGTTGTWGGSNALLDVDDVPSLTNASNQSIFTMLTCLNGFFHNLVNESFAEKLLYAQNGGAVAVWASSGMTTPDIQEIMATRFFNRIGAGNITRLGDLILDAKTTVPGGQDVRYTWVLIGDPMLKVRQDPAVK